MTDQRLRDLIRRGDRAKARSGLHQAPASLLQMDQREVAMSELRERIEAALHKGWGTPLRLPVIPQSQNITPYIITQLTDAVLKVVGPELDEASTLVREFDKLVREGGTKEQARALRIRATKYRLQEE